MHLAQKATSEDDICMGCVYPLLKVGGLGSTFLLFKEVHFMLN